jgi:hypothetical protein
VSGASALGRDERGRRQARRVGAVGFVLAVALPIVLWGPAIADIASAFKLEPGYFSGWVPWVLIAAGLAFLVPVAWSAGRSPDSRWYPRARNAYAGWGISLYLLGCALATQVAQIHDHVASPR